MTFAVFKEVKSYTYFVVVWFVTLSIMVSVHQRFGGPCRLHRQDFKVKVHEYHPPKSVLSPPIQHYDITHKTT
jgi:hypothetical protein